MTQQRADLLLVSRGLIASRAKAREAIEAGLVRADGRVIKKPSELLDIDCKLQAERAYPWVSRAGLKLEGALAQFGVDPTDRVCLDIGASTGGFTQVLLARGARHIIAVDVGRGQLDESLRTNPKVTSFEGQDARTLTHQHLGNTLPDLIVMDVSFIGIEKILPHIFGLIVGPLELVALVKPQFQAGPSRVGKRGIVESETAVLIAEEVRESLIEMDGLEVVALTDSPILGSDGNREFLLYAKRSG